MPQLVIAGSARTRWVTSPLRQCCPKRAQVVDGMGAVRVIEDFAPIRPASGRVRPWAIPDEATFDHAVIAAIEHHNQ